ncbi:hypothetical protein GGR58DRAFT_528003 [Xylaria digitata]|nr:hypothetical protein GGR58DRAFT_528003 [Xylaria digitata]
MKPLDVVHCATVPELDSLAYIGSIMPTNGFSTESNPTLKDLSNTFVLSSSASGSGQVLSEVPKALSVDPPRKRRAHLKSRGGCDSCRRRRVKCTEETPCANCIRRGDHCQRYTRGTDEASTLKMPTQVPNSSFRSTNAAVNLLHMKLFHHFQTETRQTLLCGQEAWDYVLQLSFEFDYLMNAILCIAARHLAVICPEDPTYKTAAASHLCRASSGLRGELSKGSTSIHFDAFLATSILFYYDTWTNTDYFLPPQDNEIVSEAWTDRVFGFSSSLKKTLMTGFERPWEQPSLFRQSLTKNPGDEIAAISQASPDRLAEYENFFSYSRLLTMEMLNMSPSSVVDEDQINSSSRPSPIFQTQVAADLVEDAYVPVVRRLCLILPFLDGDQPLDSPSGLGSSSTLPLLAKFILSFPLLGWSAFPALIERGDSHALFLLYHFYRAVRILLSHKDWWWAQNRAVVAEGVLRERLINKMIN